MIGLLVFHSENAKFYGTVLEIHRTITMSSDKPNCLRWASAAASTLARPRTRCAVVGQVTRSRHSHWVLACQVPNQALWLLRSPWEGRGVPHRQELWAEDCASSPVAPQPPLLISGPARLATVTHGADREATTQAPLGDSGCLRGLVCVRFIINVP